MVKKIVICVSLVTQLFCCNTNAMFRHACNRIKTACALGQLRSYHSGTTNGTTAISLAAQKFTTPSLLPLGRDTAIERDLACTTYAIRRSSENADSSNIQARLKRQIIATTMALKKVIFLGSPYLDQLPSRVVSFPASPEGEDALMVSVLYELDRQAAYSALARDFSQSTASQIIAQHTHAQLSSLVHYDPVDE